MAMYEKSLQSRKTSPFDNSSIKTFPSGPVNSFLPYLLSDSLKLKFKCKYRYHVSIVVGMNCLLLMMARDCTTLFMESQIYYQSPNCDQILSKVYSVCNIFFPLLAGYISDYIGYHMGLIALHIPTLLGCLFTLFSVSGSSLIIEPAIIGRFLFAVGGESLQVILLAVVVNYFHKTRLICQGIGLTLGLRYLGYAIFKVTIFYIFPSDIFAETSSYSYKSSYRMKETPQPQSYPQLEGPAVLSLVFTILSFLVSFSIVIFEKYWQRIVRKDQCFLEKEETRFLNDSEIYPYSFWQSFKNVLTFPIMATAIINGLIFGAFCCIVSYNRYFFEINSKNINHEEMSQVGQSYFSSVIYFLMFATGLFLIGDYQDKKGQKNFLMIFGCLLNSFAYLIFTNLFQIRSFHANAFPLYVTYYLGIGSLGVGLGFVVFSVFPSIPKLVNHKNITICYGILYCFMNLILFVLTCLSSPLTEISKNQDLLGKTPFWVLCMIGTFLAISLEFFENRNQKKQEGNKEFEKIQKKPNMSMFNEKREKKKKQTIPLNRKA